MDLDLDEHEEGVLAELVNAAATGDGDGDTERKKRRADILEFSRRLVLKCSKAGKSVKSKGKCNRYGTAW